jgi:hypothetical protein
MGTGDLGLLWGEGNLLDVTFVDVCGGSERVGFAEHKVGETDRELKDKTRVQAVPEIDDACRV